MGTPASNGKLCTKLSDMSIGDYIRCEYIAPTTYVAGTFSNLGGISALTELPTVSAATANGYFYLIKADKGLLIADRCVQNYISGAGINNAGFLTGKYDTGLNALVRSLTKNEVYNYIVMSTLSGNVAAYDNSVWNYLYEHQICQDRSTGNIVSCMFNGTTTNSVSWNTLGFTMTSHYTGGQYFRFRPVMEFIDNSKSSLIWY